MEKRPVILVVMDGIGIREDKNKTLGHANRVQASVQYNF